jgi:hypothetical protein
MKHYLNYVRTITLLAWVALALALTMLPNSVPFVGRVSRVLASTALGGAIGHAGLFGGAALLLYLALRIRLSRAWALGLAMSIALCLSTGTEVYQIVLADRDASLVDFLANWLGVFVVGFGVSYVGNIGS